MKKPGQINYEDLPESIREKIGLGADGKKGKARMVSPKLSVLGKILTLLDDMTTRDALWCLDQASEHVKRARDTEIGQEIRWKDKAKEE